MSAKSSTPSFGSRTDVGFVREQNEDSLIVAPPLFVVADGMGGHEAGEVASEIAVRTIAECAPNTLDVEALGAAVEVANREIINAVLSGQGSEGMGTTCTAAMLSGKRLIIAQVGDSRAYVLHHGRLTQITRDHSLMADLIEAGQITPEEAKVHPQRSVITRALGSDVSMEPDLYEITLEDGDRLLLCSDGLSSMVDSERIAAIMADEPDPQKCANNLVNAALSAGGLDNVTVIVADVGGSPVARASKVATKTKITVGLVLAILVFLIVAAFVGGNAYLHNSAYLSSNADGYVEVYRGAPGNVMGFSYSELVETTDIPVDELNPSAAQSIKDNLQLGSLDEALDLVQSYREQRNPETAANATSASDPSSSPSATASSEAASAASPSSGSTSSAGAAKE